MRLTCPNCAAEYDIADGMVPAAGRHVQCTVCHTRWFVAGPPRPALSEEQMLRRLETRSQHPRPVVVAAPAQAAPAEAAPTPAAPTPAEPTPAEPTPAEAAPPVATAAAPPIAPEPEPEPEPTPPPVELAPPPRQVDPAKPGERPTVARPAPLSELAAPPPRAALRLELVGETAALPEPPARNRFGSGLLLMLLLAALALAAYRYRAPIAAEVPATAPALAAYGDAVDDLRTELEARLTPLRRAVAGAQDAP